MSSKYQLLLFYVKLFTVLSFIFVARLWLINNYGTSVPLWDQWDAIASNVFLPYLNGEFPWEQLYRFHNEHRPFFSRALALLLLCLNGQWDPLVEAIVNNIIYIFTIFLFVLFIKDLKFKVDNFMFFIIIGLGAVPFASENIIGAFHSCWYLLLLFTLIALWGLLCHDNYTWPWWLGVVSSISAFFNIATGLLVLPVVIVIKLYLFTIDKGNRLKHLPTLVISILIMSFLVTFLPEKLSQTQFNYAYFLIFNSILSWPYINSPYLWLSVLIYSPFLALLLKMILWSRKPSRKELFVLGLGGWVIVQAMSMALVRGALATRYMDILAYGIIANFLAIRCLVFPRYIHLLKSIYACFYLIVIGQGLQNLMNNTWPALESTRLIYIEQLHNTRNFISTGDIVALKSKPFFHIPYPGPESLAERLNNPLLRAILPSSLTSPTPLPLNQGGTGTLSVIATKLLELNHGKILFVFGLWLLCLTVVISSRHT